MQSLERQLGGERVVDDLRECEPYIGAVRQIDAPCILCRLIELGGCLKEPAVKFNRAQIANGA